MLTTRIRTGNKRVSVLTGNDVTIAILVAVLIFFGRFPGCRLSLRQSLKRHTHTRVRKFLGTKAVHYGSWYGPDARGPARKRENAPWIFTKANANASQLEMSEKTSHEANKFLHFLQLEKCKNKNDGFWNGALISPPLTCLLSVGR